jgi:hypothetical protein
VGGEELRGRLDKERRAGVAQILVDVMLFYSRNWVPSDEIVAFSICLILQEVREKASDH